MTQPNEHDRAAMVAAIRALADFIELNTELPVPQQCAAQYSIFDDAETVAVVAAAALALGATADLSNRTATVAHEVSAWPASVRYVVHGDMPLLADRTPILDANRQIDGGDQR